MEMPCIRCGDCADACPTGLQPQHLLRALLALRPAAAHAEGLVDCSLCGLCDLACPSRISLRLRFVEAKREHLARTQALGAASAARARFEARGLRLEREQEERREREATMRKELGSSDAVAAAIARAQAKRRPPPGTP